MERWNWTESHLISIRAIFGLYGVEMTDLVAQWVLRSLLPAAPLILIRRINRLAGVGRAVCIGTMIFLLTAWPLLTAANDECLCKEPAQALYVATACPSKQTELIAAPALVPPLDYRGISVRQLLPVVAQFSRAKVCLDRDIHVAMSFRSDGYQRWPEVVAAIARRVELASATREGLIYLYRQ